MILLHFSSEAISWIPRAEQGAIALRPLLTYRDYTLSIGEADVNTDCSQ